MKKLTLSFTTFIDIIVYLIIALTTIKYLFSLSYSSSEPLVIFSFFFNGIIFFFRIVKINDGINVLRTGYIFAYVFFFMAPLQQYTDHVVLWRQNGLSAVYDDNDYLYANILVFAMIVFVELGYNYYEKGINEKKCIDAVINEEKSISIDLIKTFILVIFSTGCFIFLMISGNIFSRKMIVSNSSIDAQLRNILAFAPVVTLLLLLMNKKQKNNIVNYLFLFLVVSEIAVIFSPFWGAMSRFLLFGVYVIIIAYYFRNGRFKSFYFLFLFLGFCFVFTNTRHNSNILTWLSDNSFNFKHVDYDAYQLFLAGIKYTKVNGICFGQNIISALLFLLPREIWNGKFEGSGNIVVTYFGSWQNNVSFPLIGEFYFSFGIIGIIVLSFVIGKIICKLDSWTQSKNQWKQIIFLLSVGFTIYILRGSLLSSLSYYGGLLLTVLFTDLICKIKIKS